MVAVFQKMMGGVSPATVNGILEGDDVKDEAIVLHALHNSLLKQAVIYESGQPVLKVECGTTLEVMKLLYESEHKKKGDILGVRPRNSSEIPCIITLHESKLEESAYDVIIKDKKLPSPSNGYNPNNHENNANTENCITTRCIDCSRESWKSKRYTTVGMNTEISLNPMVEVDNLRSGNPITTSYASQTVNHTEPPPPQQQQTPTYPTQPPPPPQPRGRGRPPLQRPVPVVTHGNAYTAVQKKDYMVATLPPMPVSNGLPNSDMDYMSSHYRSRSPVNSPPSHHSSGHTKICYPSKPLSLDIGPYVPSPNIRHKIHQPRSPPYLHRSPVYNNPVWKKEPPMEPTMYPPHPHHHHPHHPPHGDYKPQPPPPPPPPMDMRRRYPQYEHHHHHQEVPASVVTRAPTPPPPRRTTTPPGSGDDDDGEGEPPVYVLPNDFDMQRDRVEPHIITYHSPKDESGADSPSADERSELPKEDTKPRTMPPEDERDSPVSDASSSKSATDENTPVAPQNDQQLACKICKQYFPTKSTLYKHLRGHSSDEKPFKCMECGQGFTLSSNLRQHRIIHRGYKPFQCEYCGKKFMRSNVYKQHRRIHTGEQMHKCDHCPSEFLQRYALIKHKKKAHNVETFDK